MKSCLNCTKKIKNNRKYCSIQCQQAFIWQQKKIQFEHDGFWVGVNHESVIARIMKKYLLEKNGNKCEICKTEQWMGKNVPLVIDHIDGNSNNALLENFRLVCGNCDMQLPTYKSKNNGNGRKWRRDKYKKNILE